MQKHQTPIEIGRRFSCISTSANQEKEIDRNTIAQQIAEFESRGGKILTIPTGLGALAAGAVVVGEEPHSMAVPRNAKKNIKTTTTSSNPDMTVAEAAAYLGKSPGYITKRIATGKLTSKKLAGCRAYFVRRSEIQLMKDNLIQGQK